MMQSLSTALLAPQPACAKQRLRVLYICYFPVAAPLVQTQVIAYLAGLARLGHRIHLLTFEPVALSTSTRRSWRKRLKAQGLIWHHARYHKSPTLPATLYDTACGVLAGLRIMRRHRLDTVHARSHVAAAMGLILKKLTGCHLVFDIRGLLAEEYADTGRWQRDSMPFRLTKSMERRCIAAADGIVLLTERITRDPSLSDELLASPAQVAIIPCCVDAEKVHGQADQRTAIRTRLGLQDMMVMVYTGQLGMWYLAEEMVGFFLAARQCFYPLHFLILTPSESSLIVPCLERQGIDATDYTLLSASPEDVGAYLAAADFAVSFIQPCPSKIASSPTKIGEYLAAGLPVVSNAGIGDVDALLLESNTGVLVPEFTSDNYMTAARQLQALLAQPDIGDRCRQTAEAQLSLQTVGIPRYDQLYQAVAAKSRDEGWRGMCQQSAEKSRASGGGNCP